MQVRRQAPAAFLLRTVAFVFLAGAAFAGTVRLLERMDLAPPPPLTGTDCIDGKLAFLRSADLAEVDLVAVGSSVTMRNLDLSSFARSGHEPLNAAPCYLYAGQTAFLADVVLDRTPKATTLLTVLSIRDFAVCEGDVEPFVDAALLGDWLDGRRMSVRLHAERLRPLAFARGLARKLEARAGEPYLGFDAYGSSFMTGRVAWWPAPEVDGTCLGAVSALARIAGRAGVRLVVASFPPSPRWRELHDPDGGVTRRFEAHLAARLTGDHVLFVSGRGFAADEDDYADGVHLMGTAAPRFSAWLAEAIRAHEPDHPAVAGT